MSERPATDSGGAGASEEGGARKPVLTRAQRESRRDTFLGDAADYAAVRPGYPGEALTAAVRLAGLGPGGRVLEIGCGTGQATAWLARHGFRVTAIDRSEPMVRYAREALAGAGDVEVRLQGFEDLEPDGSFDALLLATSYHWLAPQDRAERCARHLREDGGLVLMWHTHPRPFTGFFARVDPIYRAHMPEWEPPPSPGMLEERLQRIVEELEACGAYRSVERRGFDWSRRYSTGEYRRLLHTYSDHQLLPEDRRSALIDAVCALADADFGGAVDRPYRTEIVVARTVSGR